MSATYISEAEESLVETAEQYDLGAFCFAATNTLVYSHLIPARRFAEARLWCDDLIRLETGYESWNALSNLGIVEFESGNTSLARRYFQAIIDADMGPVDEAEEYIELIDSGEKRPLDTRVNWKYSEKWKKVDVSKPVKGKQKPIDVYLRLIKIFIVQDSWASMEGAYRISPAAAVYGFVNGVESSFADAGIEVDREVIVRACSDAIKYVFGEEAESVRPGPIDQIVDVAEPDPEVASSSSGGANFCSSCGAAMEPDSKFCTSCGAKF